MDNKSLLTLIVDHLKKVFEEHKHAPTNVRTGDVIHRTEKEGKVTLCLEKLMFSNDTNKRYDLVAGSVVDYSWVSKPTLKTQSKFLYLTKIEFIFNRNDTKVYCNLPVLSVVGIDKLSTDDPQIKQGIAKLQN